MRIVLFIVAFLFIVPSSFAAEKAFYGKAKVTAIQQQQSGTAAIQQTSEIVTIQGLEGAMKGKTYNVTVTIQKDKVLNYSVGETVLVSLERGPDGEEHVYILDYVRHRELLLLFFLFLAVVFVIGRWHGITSFIGMGISFLIIGNFIIPNILLGNNPVLISLMGALFIIPITFYLAHGVNRKTTIALAGTFLSLILTGLLAYAFVIFARLSGGAVEEAAFLQLSQGTSFDVRSLLLAGIIIGAMGVLDDITISQTSIVERLMVANPKYRFKELYMNAMVVGRDHIASLVNTLILVYTGASLPLLLLFYNTPMTYAQVVNQELIATEVVRTLVSSIGIIAAVPITTIIACMYVRK